METGLDRRTFIARAAVAGGGLMSLGALERLVARDAWAGRLVHDAAVRAAAAHDGPARHRGARAAGGVQLRDVQPHRLEDVRRQSDAAGARRHGVVRGGHGHGAAGQSHLVRLVRNSEDRNPSRGSGGLLGDRAKAYDPTGVGRHDDARVRRAPPQAGGGLRQPQRHDRQLRRRDRLSRALLAHGRGDRRRAGRPRTPARFAQAPRIPVPDAGRPRAERARAAACRSPRPGGSRTRRRRSISAPGSSTRPRTRARAWARGSIATRRRTRDDLAKGGTLRDAGDRAGGRRSTCARAARAAQRLPVTWVRHRRARPGR